VFEDSDSDLLLADTGTRPVAAPSPPAVEGVLRIALVVGLLIALVFVVAGVPELAGDDGPGGPVRKLGRVALEPVPGELPVVAAEIGQAARVQVTVLRETAPRTYTPVVTRRLGVVKAGTTRLQLGSGHAADGISPGEVLDTSRLLPFSVVAGEGGGLPPGDYAATVQMRSIE
jgi:hypothetical protein